MKSKKLLYTFSLLIFFVNGFFTISVKGQEKVTVRTDREIYIGGEQAWISITCFETKTNQPSQISKLVYLELLNESKSPVLQVKLPLENGSGSTLIDIPDTLSTGNYMIRAYTSWMRNLNPNLYSRKVIGIVNPFSKNKYPNGELAYATDTVLFFPEGGKLLEGRKNQMLVRILDKSGNGVGVEARITSSDNSNSQKFRTDNQGFAKIDLKPEKGISYTLSFKSDDDLISFDLPLVRGNSTVLQLIDLDASTAIFQLISNEKKVSSVHGKLHFVSPEGKFLFNKDIDISDGSRVTINSAGIPSGDLCAILIDQDNKILSSRYFAFEEANADGGFLISLNKGEYGEREKVELEIVKPKGLQNVSVSVVKACLTENISSLQNPAFVGCNLKSKLADEVDYNDFLMALKPVDRFIDNANSNMSMPEPYGELIQGVVTDNDTGKPMSNANLMLSFVSDQPNLEISKTDSLGRFRFEVNQTGEKEIVIQPLTFKQDQQNYSIELDQSYSESYLTGKIPPLFVSRKKMDQLNQCIINTQIVSWYNSKIANRLPVAPGNPFYGTAEFVIPIEKFIDLPNMEEVIREIVTMVQLRKKSGEFHIRVIGDDVKDYDNALVMVDGVPVWDHDEVLKILPPELLRIEVVNIDYFIGDQNIGPILSILTKKGNLSAMDLNKKIFRQARQGYAFKWQFDEPDYEVDSIRALRTPDFRNTLYWNPNVDFHESDKVQLSFYTADEDTKYKLIVDGVNSFGEIERRVLPLRVMR